jgi:hypothetical protein
LNAANFEHAFTCLRRFLIVSTVAAIPAQPRKCSLDCPTPFVGVFQQPLTISRGQLAKVISKVSAALEQPYEELREDLPGRAWLDIDETGWESAHCLPADINPAPVALKLHGNLL